MENKLFLFAAVAAPQLCIFAAQKSRNVNVIGSSNGK